LLRQADQALNLTQQLADVIPDLRNQDKITHSLSSLLKQRIFAIACGYEDLNDHTTLRNDPGFQTAVESDKTLASASTLCRLDNSAYRQVAFDMHRVMVDQFIASFKEPPDELMLDFDATDDLVHGNQEGSFFHGYYGNYCFLPLYVFCGSQLLVSYLRPANQDAAKHAWAILSLLVKRLRQSFPEVNIIFRGDGGFCRDRMLSWCSRHHVDYIVGMPQNKRLIKGSMDLLEEAGNKYNQSEEKQRLFGDFLYAAGSWKKERRIIVKAEHTSKGANPRFIVTSLSGDPQALYDDMYCARGDMENRIKEQQLGLFADRTSCHDWWANQFRLLLSSAAYLLVETIRRIGLKGTLLANAQVTTIRLKLFKIGAVIIRNTRRVQFLLSSACPYQDIFFHVAEQFSSS